VVSQRGADAWLNGLVSGDQRRLTGSGSAEACSRRCDSGRVYFTFAFTVASMQSGRVTAAAVSACDCQQVDDDKLRVLIAHVLDHPVLTELDLSHNAISDRGARALGKLLNGHSQLTALTVSNNNIRSAGAQAIGHALTRNSTLLRLDLRLNQLGDDGGQAVCRALLRNTSLVDVVLAGNELTERTAAAMAQVISQNDVLTSVDLSCNRLGQVRSITCYTCTTCSVICIHVNNASTTIDKGKVLRRTVE